MVYYALTPQLGVEQTEKTLSGQVSRMLNSGPGPAELPYHCDVSFVDHFCLCYASFLTNCSYFLESFRLLNYAI